jgi:hypothetical protein
VAFFLQDFFVFDQLNTDFIVVFAIGRGGLFGNRCDRAIAR